MTSDATTTQTTPSTAPADKAPTAEQLGDEASYGSCHNCHGAGIIEGFDEDYDCSGCDGTGDITQGYLYRSERSTR